MRWFSAMLVVLTCGAMALAQSSSLYVQPPRPQPSRGDMAAKPENRLSPDIAAASLTAVALPPPRKFARYDLITIIVRESVKSDSTSSLDTEKRARVKGKIAAFPRLMIADLLQGRLRNSTITDGPELNVQFRNRFESEGEYEREDTFIARVTARVIDVKPNGTLVLEARKYIKSDKETLEMVVTGTCRKEDIQTDNTVLSTQLYDLNVVKNHSGAVSQTSRKGILSKLLDLVFNF